MTTPLAMKTHGHPRKGTEAMSRNRTITLTGRRPVTVGEDEWPVIASADGDDDTDPNPATHQQTVSRGECDEFTLKVRQHADGRTLVYGVYTEGYGTSHDGLTRAGELLDCGDGIPEALERVGETLGVPRQIIADAVADLPAERI